MKQLIIARKDLNMSPGKLAAQVSHASMAFLTNGLQKHSKKILDCDSIPAIAYDESGNKYPRLYKRNDLCTWAEEAFKRNEPYVYYRPVNSNDPYGKLELCKPIHHYQASINFDINVWEDWICGSFTKIICEAKNKYQLEKIIPLARELGLEEGKDFFLIKDNCYTELTPEEIDENGIGRTLTCIGFRPLEDEVINKLSKKYQLYR